MKYTLRINGRTHEVDGEAGDSLLSVLRYDLGLTGSKYGCGEGFCGACTVLVDGETARSCMVRLGATAGKALLGGSFRVTKDRGALLPLPAEEAEGARVVATLHPSAVLRADDRDAAYAGLVSDLRVAAEALAEDGPRSRS